MTLVEDREELTSEDPGDVDARPRPRGAVGKIRRRLHGFLTLRRRPLVKVHRWLSFVLMLWIVVESLSGGSIVFSGEIDRFWNSDQFHATPGDIGMPAAITAAKAARPTDLVRYVTAPKGEDGGGMYWVWMTDRHNDYHSVLVDPGSGTITSTDHQPPLLIHWMEQVHYNLNSTSIFGIQPLTIMGWMAVGWLVILLTGFYTWYWPGIKRWARIVRVRRRRGPFTFHLDLHNMIGVAVLIPLTVVVVTGINFAFPDQVKSVWNAVTLGRYQEPDVTTPLSTKSPGQKAITSQQAIDAVQQLDPSISIDAVFGPGGSPVGVYEVDATVDGSFLGNVGGAREVEFSVEQYTGGIISVDDPADKGFASQAYDDWAYPVHTGTFGGTITRVLWVGLGLAPAVLAVTGTRMWFVRRRKRLRRARGAAPESGSDVDVTSDPVINTIDITGTQGENQ